MKFELDGNDLKILREVTDKKYYGVGGESTLYYDIKNALNKMGFDLIKKKPDKDGQMMSAPWWLRTRNAKSKTPHIFLFDPNYALRFLCEIWNDQGQCWLEIGYDVHDVQPDSKERFTNLLLTNDLGIDFPAFVRSYLATAAWVTCDSDECQEFTEKAKERAENDCRKFIAKVVEEMGRSVAQKMLTTEGNDLTYLAPHDFFLTRCGHGSGFWDKDIIYGEDNAEQLTDISKGMGSVECMHLAGKKSKLVLE